MLDEMMQAVSEDFSIDELIDVPFMRVELPKLIDINDVEIVPFLFGAVQLYCARNGRKPLWKALLNVQ